VSLQHPEYQQHFMEERMNRLRGSVGSLCLLAFLLASASAHAATATAAKRAPLYDPSKEITLEGNLSSLKASIPGSLAGGHMLVSTPKGTIDGHLGPYAFSGRNRVQIAAGTHIKMVGVMTTIRGSQIFLVRTIETGTTKYTIRSPHGFPLLPDAVQPTKSINFVSPKGDRQ
jgi:hypothetical protein